MSATRNVILPLSKVKPADIQRGRKIPKVVECRVPKKAPPDIKAILTVELTERMLLDNVILKYDEQSKEHFLVCTWDAGDYLTQLALKALEGDTVGRKN